MKLLEWVASITIAVLGIAVVIFLQTVATDLIKRLPRDTQFVVSLILWITALVAIVIIVRNIIRGGK